MSGSRANATASQPPETAAVRVPPSACNTSQSTVKVRSPNRERSTPIRKLRPISRDISWVRPLGQRCSRAVRVWVLRGSRAYSAVSQPWGSGACRSHEGRLLSMETLQRTWVSPNLASTEPSAWRVKWSSNERGRRSVGRSAVMAGRVSVVMASDCNRGFVRGL